MDNGTIANIVIGDAASGDAGSNAMHKAVSAAFNKAAK